MHTNNNHYSISVTQSKKNLARIRNDQYELQKNHHYSKKRRNPIEKQKVELNPQQGKKEQNKSSSESHGNACLAAENKKVKQLIMDVITSADQTVKAILPYGHTEIQQYCRAYFLNKEKLFSYLHAKNPEFFTQNNKANHYSQKRRHKKKESVSSKMIEIVPINHLERLQKIVYSKIIPILENSLEIQKNNNQKLMKKGKETNSDYKDGIMLLQRLNQNQRIAVDQCAQILQKFIIRIMEKQEKMLTKINRLQQKLNQEIKKTEIISQESKRWEQHRFKIEKQFNKQKKNLHKYQQFTKQIKLVFLEKDRLMPQMSQRQYLQEILTKIKAAHNEDKLLKRDKKCDHKQHKDIHSSCKEQAGKSQKHIKSLKDVIKSINTQNHHLQQQCDHIENRLKITTDLLKKFQSQSQKMIAQNQSLNSKIHKLQGQQSYKVKVIEEYLRIIDRLEQSIRTNQENIAKLNQENEGYLDLITKHANQKEEYIKHIVQLQEKEKQMEDAIGKKEMEIQQIINQLNSKIQEGNEHKGLVKHYKDEIQKKNQMYQSILKQNSSLKQVIKLLRQKQTLKESYEMKSPCINDNNTLKTQPLKDQQHQIIPNLQSQNNMHQLLQTQQKGLRQSTMELKENTKFQIATKQQGKQQTKLLAPKTDDFIPANINKELQPPATVVDQFYIDPTQNKRREEREDYIPACINIQILPEHHDEQLNKTNSIEQTPTLHALNDQIQELNQNNENLAQQFKFIHDQIAKKTKQPVQANMPDELQIIDQAQPKPTKIEHLDLNQHIGEHFLQLKQKMAKQVTCKQGLSEIQKEIQYMASLLKIYKRNTLKKLEKMKTQLSQQQDEEQIQRLKKRLDETLVANQHYSNTQSNSQDSDFAYPLNLNSFFNNQNPFVNKVYLQSDPSHHANQTARKEIFTQTQDPTRKLLTSIESEVANMNQSLLTSQVRNLRLTDIFSKQLLNESQGNYSPSKPLKAQSIVNFGDLGALASHFSLRDTENPKQTTANPQSTKHQQNFIKYYENKQLGERRESIISLDRLLQEQNQNQNNSQLQIQQPKQQLNKSLLYNTQNEAKSSNYQCIVVHSQNSHPSQIKKAHNQRQGQTMNQMNQKDQEIERLKSIIKSITKSQQIQISQQCKQADNTDNKNNILDLLLKQKQQIQRLTSLIKNYELHEKIQQFKKSYRQNDEQHSQDNKNDQYQVKYIPISNKQVIIYQMVPINTMNSALDIYRETQSQLNQNNFIKQERIKSFQSISPLNNTPNKQITTKSQSSKQRNQSSTKRGFQFGWSELVPEYFGTKQQDHK